jgi:hypothetical protein
VPPADAAARKSKVEAMLAKEVSDLNTKKLGVTTLLNALEGSITSFKAEVQAKKQAVTNLVME